MNFHCYSSLVPFWGQISCSHENLLTKWRGRTVTFHSCTAKGRSPDWTLWRFDSLPGLPVVISRRLRITVTSSRRICTRFPFHQTHMVWHLTHLFNYALCRFILAFRPFVVNVGEERDLSLGAHDTNSVCAKSVRKNERKVWHMIFWKSFLMENAKNKRLPNPRKPLIHDNRMLTERAFYCIPSF